MSEFNTCFARIPGPGCCGQMPVYFHAGYPDAGIEFDLLVVQLYPPHGVEMYSSPAWDSSNIVMCEQDVLFMSTLFPDIHRPGYCCQDSLHDIYIVFAPEDLS